ncbi:hypothetical protein ACWGJP_08215 [Microbacterium sp. NPDC055903]
MTISRPSRSDGIALGIIATGAVSVAVAALIAIGQAAFAVFADDVEVRMQTIGAAPVDIDGGDGLVSAGYATADVAVAAAPAGIRWMLLLEVALPALATVGVCVVAYALGVSLMRARPFRRAMPAALATVACLVIVGGVSGQLLGAIARGAIVEHLETAGAGVADLFPAFSLDLDLSPVGWGFALALVAGAFSIGQRLQRDTEGLV